MPVPVPVLFTTPYVPEANALFARFTTPPSDARKVLINNLIKSFIAAGVWAKLDALYIFAAADAQGARLNWVQNLYNATAVSSPTFTTDRGYAGNGTSSYVDSTFNPSTASGPKFVQDSAYFGYWSRTSATQSSSAAGYFDGTKGVTRNARSAGNDSSGRVNQAANTTTAGGLQTDGSGLIGIARSGSAALRLSRNGSTILSDTVVSASPANGTLRFGTIANGTFSAVQFAAGMIGSNLSAAEELSAYNAMLTYMQAVGAA